MDPPQKSSGSRLPMAKITALTRLKSLTDTVTSRRQNSGVVFPPASWEIDRLVIDSNNGWSQTKSETPSSGEEAVAELAETVVSTEVPVALEPEPVTFAQRIRELIVSLPLPGTSKPSKPPVADVADAEVLKAGDGSAGPPVPPGVDQELVMMLCSEEVMNGDEEEGREEGAERPSVWSILSKMRWKGKTKETGGPERSDFHGQDGLMMYAPLEPANDSTLELAEVCSISNASIPPGSPVPEQPSEDIEWMPSTTQISVYATWWGYRLYLPPPVMATLDSVSLKATAQGAMVTGALKWLLDKVPDMLVPPQFKPALALLRRLGPVVGYVGVFVAWSWTRIKNHDRGNGVVLMATWLLPVALVPMAWDVGDIYGPVLLPKPEDRKPAPSEGDGNKEHETKKTKKGFWHL